MHGFKVEFQDEKSWEAFKRIMSVIGAKGGRSRSPAKLKAIKENAKKATLARMAKRERGIKL